MKLMLGNCLDKLKELEDNSVDSVVTDPPYGLSFMGKKWDYDVPAVNIWEECFRVLKPGGHLLAFAGTRTQHRMAVNIEDAGFEIRDMIAWVYGSGFPKSHNIGKAIDKMGAIDFEEFKEDLAQVVNNSKMTRKQIDDACGFTMKFDTPYKKDPKCWGVSLPSPEKWKKICEVLDMDEQKWSGLIEAKWRGRAGEKINENTSMSGGNFERTQLEDPYTDGAKKWEGWGTALKPALEPITVARKPVESTVAANVLKYGTGAINIDASRVESNGDHKRSFVNRSMQMYYDVTQNGFQPNNKEGRYPANLIHDGSDEVVELFPESNSTRVDNPNQPKSGKNNTATSYDLGNDTVTHDFRDNGSAARFFYCAKASKSDRNEGLDTFKSKVPAAAEFRPNHTEKAANGEDGNPYGRWSETKNIHPTVKPTDLMKYLIRLVTPKDGVVLDPFMGSGSTGKAAKIEGFDFIGIELDEEYFQIAQARIDAVEKPTTLEEFF